MVNYKLSNQKPQLLRQVGAAAGDVALPLLAAALKLSPGRPVTQKEKLAKNRTKQHETASKVDDSTVDFWRWDTP